MKKNKKIMVSTIVAVLAIFVLSMVYMGLIQFCIKVSPIGGSQNLYFIIISLCYSAMITLVFIETMNYRFRMKKEEHEKLESIAYIDVITGGNTYNKFQVDAEKLITEGLQNRYVIVYMDVERFRYVNDVYGYEEGNFALRFIWENIQGMIKAGETAGRIGEDKFIVLLQFEKTVDEIVSRLNEFYANVKFYPILQEDSYYTVIITSGIYEVIDSTIDIKTMVDCAKLSQKRVKGSSESICAIYTKEIKEELLDFEKMEDSFENALKEKEFVVYYQPKYNLKTNSFDGAEALVRWMKKSGEMISPGKFIPVFEKSGSILKLDQYVFKMVCKDIRKWLDAGYVVNPISVNVSRRQINSKHFTQIYFDIMKEYQIPPACIQLEITESMIMESEARLIEIINTLHENGIFIEMDDFGSGYSSLSMLSSIPIDVIKLDRGFAEDIIENEKAKSIVSSLIRLAKSIGMSVVAEGIELEEQVEFLKEEGCDLIQGFYFAKPMDKDNYTKIIENK